MLRPLIGVLLAILPLDAFAQNRGHVTAGASGNPYVLFPTKKAETGEKFSPYIGVVALPELRFSYSLDPTNDKTRLFISGRWTGLAGLAAGGALSSEAIQPQRGNGTECAAMAGISVDTTSGAVAPALTNPLTSTISKISFAAGYGNFAAADGKYLPGFAMMFSIDVEALSLNF